MTNEMKEKLNKLFKLMDDHQLSIKGDINEDFKCLICRRILQDPCRSECGCNFCKTCIDRNIMDGRFCCPGRKEECGSCNISNIVNDHSMNELISSIIVKCPREMCGYECEMINMYEHIQICMETNVNCPFKSVGCDQGQMSEDKLEEHLQLGNNNHNKLMIDTINNLKNEIDLKENGIVALKESDERNRKAITSLTRYTTKRKEDVKGIQQDLVSLKQNSIMTMNENQKLKQDSEKHKMESDKQMEIVNRKMHLLYKQDIENLKENEREQQKNAYNMKEKMLLLEKELKVSKQTYEILKMEQSKERNVVYGNLSDLRSEIAVLNFGNFIKMNDFELLKREFEKTKKILYFMGFILIIGILRYMFF